MSTQPRGDSNDAGQLLFSFMTEDERQVVSDALMWYVSSHGEKAALIYGFASRHNLDKVCKFIDYAISRSLCAGDGEKGGSDA